MTPEGAAALGQFSTQISLIGTPNLWREAVYTAKALGSGVADDMNEVLVAITIWPPLTTWLPKLVMGR
jgi:hypothetical protein